jgi:hypothetical protein
MLANACTQVSWWHNGLIVQVDKREPMVSNTNVHDVSSARETHQTLELQPGVFLLSDSSPNLITAFRITWKFE